MIALTLYLVNIMCISHVLLLLIKAKDGQLRIQLIFFFSMLAWAMVVRVASIFIDISFDVQNILVLLPLTASILSLAKYLKTHFSD